MNRTITTAAELDALPVKVVLLDEGGWPVWRDPHTGWCASNGTQGIPADLLIADGAPLTVLFDPSDPAPAPPVAPEAAVEALREALNAYRAEVDRAKASSMSHALLMLAGATLANAVEAAITPKEDR